MKTCGRGSVKMGENYLKRIKGLNLKGLKRLQKEDKRDQDILVICF
jgi:hypothetical protein